MRGHGTGLSSGGSSCITIQGAPNRRNMPGADQRKPDLRSPGRCPRCTARIPQRAVLIEYGTGDPARMFAECPGCDSVVHPDP